MRNAEFRTLRIPHSAFPVHPTSPSSSTRAVAAHHHPPQPGVFGLGQVRVGSHQGLGVAAGFFQHGRVAQPGRRSAAAAGRAAACRTGRPARGAGNRSRPGRKPSVVATKAFSRSRASSVCGVGEHAAEAGKLAAADPPAQLVQLGQAEPLGRSRSSSAWRWARPRPPRPPTCRPAPGSRPRRKPSITASFSAGVMRPWIRPRRKASSSPLASAS